MAAPEETPAETIGGGLLAVYTVYGAVLGSLAYPFTLAVQSVTSLARSREY